MNTPKDENAIHLRAGLHEIAKQFEPTASLDHKLNHNLRLRRRRRRLIVPAIVVAIVLAAALAGVTVASLSGTNGDVRGGAIGGRPSTTQTSSPDVSAPPASRSVAWRQWPFGPLDRAIVQASAWTGSEMIFWAQRPEGDSGVNGVGVLAAWSPTTGNWRELALPDPDWLFATIAVADGQLIALFGAQGPFHEVNQYELDAGGYVMALPDGPWERLPNAPVQPRTSPTLAWTGSELLFWGGYAGPVDAAGLDDGAALDPAAGRWRVLSPAPIPGGSGPAVWSGSGLLVWGGHRSADSWSEVVGDGAVYAPNADTWRIMAQSTLGPRDDAGVAWTGEEMIIAAGRSPVGDQFQDVAAYDPKADDWRALPELPTGAGGIALGFWTGTEFGVVTFTGTGPPVAVVAHPDASAWTTLSDPDGDVGAFAGNGAWAGDRLVVWSAAGNGQLWTLDP